MLFSAPASWSSLRDEVGGFSLRFRNPELQHFRNLQVEVPSGHFSNTFSLTHRNISILNIHMVDLDNNLKKLRLPVPVQKILACAEVSDFAELVSSPDLLEKVRKHLNPIQHSKLNALIKEFETSEEHTSEYNGADVLLNTEKSASRKDILGQLQFERQCLEELNNIIVDDSDDLTLGAKQIVQKSKAAHQARANRLSAILRTKPQEDEAISSTDPNNPMKKKEKTLTKQVKFEVTEKVKDCKFTAIQPGSRTLTMHCFLLPCILFQIRARTRPPGTLCTTILVRRKVFVCSLV